MRAHYRQLSVNLVSIQALLGKSSAVLTLPLSNIKQTLRTHANSSNRFVSLCIKLVYALYRPIVICKKIYSNDKYRAQLLLKWFSSNEMHQISNSTAMDRYPGIFSACRDYFGAKQNLKILSFGCSSGEEVLTLRKYFPSALITGSEINRHALSLCRKHKVDEKVTFVYSNATNIRKHAPYDAVFCMAVLQRSPNRVKNENIRSLKEIYPFEQFDRQISEFDRYLSERGLLVVQHAQYLFREASVSGNYQPIRSDEQEIDYNPKFDRNSERLKDTARRGAIFIKIRNRTTN